MNSINEMNMRNIRWWLARYVCGVPKGLEFWEPKPNIVQKWLLRKLINTYPQRHSIRKFLEHPLIK